MRLTGEGVVIEGPVPTTSSANSACASMAATAATAAMARRSSGFSWTASKAAGGWWGALDAEWLVTASIADISHISGGSGI